LNVSLKIECNFENGIILKVLKRDEEEEGGYKGD
jgi:hypothetical protein